MRRLVGLGLVALLPACGQAPAGPDVVATYHGGTVRVREVEEALRRTPGGVPHSGRDELLQAYRREAESLVVERTVLAGITDRESFLASLGEEYQRLRRDAVLELYRRELGQKLPPVKASEVERFYEENRDAFHLRPRCFLLYIFRRNGQEGSSDHPVALLRRLRERAMAGESFEQLAREYSHSETRLLGGRLGWIGPGVLPAKLEKTIFSLDKGEISEPLPVSGGFAIFLAHEVVRERQVELEDVRGLIRQRLEHHQLRRAIRETLKGEERPAGSLILDAPQLVAALRQGAGDTVVLEMEGYRLTVAQLLELVEQSAPQLVGLPFLEPKVDELYAELVEDQLLLGHARASGFLDRPDTREALADLLERKTVELMLRSKLKETMRERIGKDPAQLRTFFDSNRFLYQSPLRLKLKSLAVPLAADPGRQQSRLEQLREQLVAGKLSLDEAARQVGSGVVDLGWTDAESLLRLEPKVASYALDLKAGSFSSPFQLNHQLIILAVEERQEPEQLELEQVADRVRDDFVERHQQRLYREIRDELLAQTDFQFHEAAVLRALQLPAAGPASPKE